MAAVPLKDVANISEWVPERVPMHLKYADRKIDRSAPICEKHPSHHEEPIMVGGAYTNCRRLNGRTRKKPRTVGSYRLRYLRPPRSPGRRPERGAPERCS